VAFKRFDTRQARTRGFISLIQMWIVSVLLGNHWRKAGYLHQRLTTGLGFVRAVLSGVFFNGFGDWGCFQCKGHSVLTVVFLSNLVETDLQTVHFGN
jgi:hypothetical protein